MNLPVKLNKQRQIASIVFAEGHDFSFLEKWKKQLDKDTLPARVDSVAFAHLAHSRYLSHSHEGTPYVTGTEEFKAYINDNPKKEVGCLVLLTCNWFPDSDVLGLCHFRRSWCNHIVLDYLRAHPFITAPTKNCRNIVNGVGLAMLFYVTEIARQCKSKLIWGEATQNSHKFYKKVFKLPSVKDLIYVPQAKFGRFYDRIKKGWNDEENQKRSAIIEEINEIEVEHPPFLGTKANVFIPPRKSIQHLLELPRHEKLQVARVLKVYAKIKPDMTDTEVAKLIIQEATEMNDLDKLWGEVEKHSKRNVG